MLGDRNILYSAVGKRLADLVANAEGKMTCDMSKAKLPAAPIVLPAPDAGLSLYHIAMGRGTQNYTCDLSNSTAVPFQTGAEARLFNVTCLSSTYPDLVQMMPSISLRFPVPLADTNDKLAPANLYLSGHHYFPDVTTPFFNLTTAEANYGMGGFKKDNATPAPNPAKDVPWLKLSAKDPESCNFFQVYRVNTAGGVAPKTCQGQQAAFNVEYAAEYWIYK
ncbi:hypothetical protein K402DRAFT_87275 [Aulographum hederae CBS 113979]|uniref:Malate dehydrogenase n=1 Tax=Aulographum hederae CBS 113979 TaxID=1176131 RepID=A0A6G1GZF0_9PEZI|nr:hypothetical protein K402DRAFT_87275 [Aulographum hederae CBS 113979]